jgi:hypothetical protein
MRRGIPAGTKSGISHKNLKFCIVLYQTAIFRGPRITLTRKKPWLIRHRQTVETRVALVALAVVLKLAGNLETLTVWHKTPVCVNYRDAFWSGKAKLAHRQPTTNQGYLEPTVPSIFAQYSTMMNGFSMPRSAWLPWRRLTLLARPVASDLSYPTDQYHHTMILSGSIRIPFTSIEDNTGPSQHRDRFFLFFLLLHNRAETRPNPFQGD